MPIWKRVLSLLGVQLGEARLVGRMLSLYLVLIGAVVLIQSMAFGLFIAEFGSGRLPYAYLTIAGLATVVSFAYLRLGARVSFERLLTFNLAFLALGSLVLWAGLRSPLADAATFLLPVWFQIFVTLANLVVWPLAMRLFDVRQGKRVFGLIGAGNWMANMLGGLVVAPLVALVGPANLMALAAIVVVGGWLLLRGIVRDHLVPTEATATTTEPVSESAPRSPLGAYAWRIFAYTAAWWLAFYFVDNLFYAQAGSHYADAESLTAFIGRFLSITGAVALFTTVVLTSRVLRRFGLAAGLLTLPVLVAVAVALVAVGGSVGVPALVLFWLATAAKLSNVAIGFSLSQTSHNVMYQALEGRARERVQTIAEGIVQPVAIGVAGGALLLLTAGLGLGSVGLAWVLTPVAAVWIVLTLRVSASYPHTLAQTLKRRRWGEGRLAPLDATALGLLRANLHDERPGPVLYALESLETSDGGLTPQVWQRVLGHPVEEVRSAAVARLAAEGPSLAPLLEDRLAVETVPSLRADLMRTLAGMGSASAVEAASLALEEPYPEVRTAAVVTLLRQGSEEQASRAAAVLERLAASALPRERALASRVIADLGPAGEHGGRWLWVMAPLLDDDSVEVRREALLAASRLRDPSLWPTVARSAARPGSARHAEKALVAGGARALAALAPHVAAGDLPAGALVAVARACGRAGADEAASLLDTLRRSEVGQVRHAALEALVAGKVAASPRAGAEVRGELEEALERGGRLAAVIERLPDHPGAALLVGALREAWLRERDTALLLAALAGDEGAVLDARAALSRAEPGARGRALEVVEVQAPARLRGLLLPWLEAEPPSQGARGAGERVEPEALAEQLQELVAGSAGRQLGPWLRACALHLIGASQLSAARGVAAAAVGDPEPLVSETARWALRRLSASGVQEEDGMLSSLERAIILKGVRFFSGAPHEILADVAALLDELEVAEGEDVVRRGEAGDSLYVVAEGKVVVRDGERVIESLGEGEAFGEMALLDPGPRSATVTAAAPTRLLRLSRLPFVDLVLERPEVAVGIMEVLVRRLRSRVDDLAARERGDESPREHVPAGQ